MKRRGMGPVTTSSVVLTSPRNLLLLRALFQGLRLSSSQSQEDRELSLVLCDDLDGWDGRWVQERESICIYIVGSLYCTAETNNTVKPLCSS